MRSAASAATAATPGAGSGTKKTESKSLETYPTSTWQRYKLLNETTRTARRGMDCRRE